MACLNYTISEVVEAVDAVGRWEAATVLKAKEVEFLVNFVGWSARFDRWVSEDEIRKQEIVSAEDGRVSRRRKQKRPASKLSNLQAGDYVTVKDDDGQVVNAEVLVVDQFRGTLRCVGITTLLTEEAIDPEEIGQVSQTQKKKKAAPKRKGNHTSKGNKPDQPQQQKTVEGVETVHAVVIMEPVANTEHAHDLLATVNRSGTFVQGGEVYSFHSAADLSVGVKTVTSDFNVVGKLIIGNEFRSNIEVRMSTDLLTDKSIKLNRAAQRELADCSILNNPAIIRDSPVHVRMGLRRALLGKHLGKEINIGLKSKSFRRYFSLGSVCPEFDLEILDMDRSHRVEYSHSKHNLGSMDSLLGTCWDLRKLSDQCTFVTKLVLRVKDLQLVGKVWCAICRVQLPTDHRSFLSTYEVAPCDNDTECTNDGGDFDW